MTKHLRFLFVSLLTLVWSVGWAQTTIDFTQVKWNNGYTQAPFSFEGNKGGNINNNVPTQNAKAKDIRLYAKNKLTVSTTGDKMVKIVFTISTKGKEQWAELTATSGSVVADIAKSIATWENVEGATSVTFTVGDNCKYGTAATTKAGQFFFKSVDIYELSAGPSKTPTKVTFPIEYSNKTFTFTEGKLEGFTAPTATEANNIAGSIKYSSNNESVVSVNASTGELSFPGYGEATITATFTPTDAETYNVSTDSYKVVNKEDLGDFVFYESFDKCDGKGGNDGTFKGTLSTVVVSENNGWKFTKGSGANKCIKLGSTSKGGSATTPAINLSGKGILTFKIASWVDDNSEVTISVDNGSLSYNGKKGTSFAISPTDKEWKDINMTISATGAVKITFSSNKRFFLDEVMVKEIATPAVENITLDESATKTIEAKTGVNVTLNRPMNVGRWNTFCVPFSIDANQVTSQFGEGTQIAEYSVSVDNEIDFATVQSNAIVAGKAYLVKPTKEAATEGYTFSNVNITALKPTKETVDNGAIDFRGIYNSTDITVGLPANTFAAGIVGNVVKKAVNGSNMKGFRAFFIIPEGAGAQSSYMLKIDGTATSINSINGADVVVNAPVYNLQGQRVDGNNLTPGIYVKAGKKFVVK